MNSSENPSSDPESKEVLINGVPQDWREAWPISEFETTFLFPGDKIEVLRLVGGG
jgi:sulfur carrier protein ThiS